MGEFEGCLAGHESGLDARGYDVVRANPGTCTSAPAVVSTAFFAPSTPCLVPFHRIWCY